MARNGWPISIDAPRNYEDHEDSGYFCLVFKPSVDIRGTGRFERNDAAYRSEIDVKNWTSEWLCLPGSPDTLI